MFTGIVEGMGTVQAMQRREPGAARALIIDAGPIAHGVRPGESVCVQGACLTVVEPATHETTTLRFDVLDETLRKTNLGRVRPGERLNLERAMRADGRLDGHFVQGHVDDVGTVVERFEREGETRLTVHVPESVFELCVPQGAIALDGVSLTVAALDESARTVTVALIPVTLEHTTLGECRVGELVNLEGDMLGKYVLSFLKRHPRGSNAS